MKLARTTLLPRTILCGALGMTLGAMGMSPGAWAQAATGAPNLQYGQAQAAFSQPFSEQSLDRMLAPIALYPDALLSQILMAATYPLEVVEAARWLHSRPGLEGDAAVRAAADQDWDPSVQSMTAFPQILAMMDERLGWTEDLGDAFLAQESQVMDTIQTLRYRAQAAGNLRSTEQVRVEQQDRTIVLTPVNPRIVYLPYYDPNIIFGAWWWPAPPVYWQPWPGYAARPGVSLSFVFGNGTMLSSGFFFGRFDWTQRRTNVVYVNNYYRTVIIHRNTSTRVIDRPPHGAPAPWRHDPSHRHGIPYRDTAVRQQFVSTQQLQRPVSDERRAAAQHYERRAEARQEVRRREAPARAAPAAPTAPAATATPAASAAVPVAPAVRTTASTADARPERRPAPRMDPHTGTRPDPGPDPRSQARAEAPRQDGERKRRGDGAAPPDDRSRQGRGEVHGDVRADRAERRSEGRDEAPKNSGDTPRASRRPDDARKAAAPS